MSEPTFAQPAPRSFMLPTLFALAALAVAMLLAIHFFPATSVDIAHVHTDVLPTHTVFESHSMVVGPAHSEDILFVAETLRVDNRIRLPIFLDDFNLTFTNPDGAELTARAVSKEDLANLETSFPELKPLLSTPLLRETSLDPGKSAQGTILFSLKVPQSMWDARKSAIVQVDLYHQPSLYQTIPKP